MSDETAGSAMTSAEIAMDFLSLASSGSVREAYSKYIAPGFRHHNPFFRGDAESLMVAMEENASANPNKVFEIKRTIQDGDFVAVHSWVRQRPSDLGVSVVHIFRFEGGLIAELWDVGQPVPDQSPNTYGMF